MKKRVKRVKKPVKPKVRVKRPAKPEEILQEYILIYAEEYVENALGEWCAPQMHAVSFFARSDKIARNIAQAKMRLIVIEVDRKIKLASRVSFKKIARVI